MHKKKSKQLKTNINNKIFQDDVRRGAFELDPAGLPTDILLSECQLDRAHKNLFGFKSATRRFKMIVLSQILMPCQLRYFYRQGSKIQLIANILIFKQRATFFYSMLKIYIMLSNRELSICDNIRQILSTMTKKFMVFLVCLYF